jgi:hypothetical protein
MPLSDLLRRLQGVPLGEPINWPQIREEIHDEYDRTTTAEERVILLELFKATMDLVERQSVSAMVDAETLDQFRNAREADYRLFILKESLVGENVSVDLLDAVTRREVAAGRMAMDHSLRQLAEEGMASPHLSPDELRAMDAQKRAPTVSRWRRAFSWLRGA